MHRPKKIFLRKDISSTVGSIETEMEMACTCACSTARGMYQRQKVRVWADTGRRAGKVVSGNTFRKQQDIIKSRLQWWGPYESANAQPSLPDVAGTCDEDVKTALLGMRFP